MKELIQGQDNLEQIEIALRYLEYDLVFVPKQEAQNDQDTPIPHDHLVIFGLQSPEGEDFAVRLFYLEDMAEYVASLQNQSFERGPNRTLCASIHTQLFFPLDRYQELAQLVNLVNQQMPGPRFKLGSASGIELEQRYVHPHKSPELKVVVEMLDRLNRFFILFAPLVKAVLFNELALDKAVHALTERLKGSSHE